MHVLAVQHTPAAHDEMPVQWTSQLKPSQRTFPGQELTPTQLTVLVPPCAVTPPGQADAPVQVMLQSAALHVTPVMHELVPHVTAQLEPPHATAPQLVADEQSTVHELAEVQSTFTPLAASAVTEQGMPAGQVQGLDAHAMTHVPALQVPPLHSAGEQPASVVAGPSRSTSAMASMDASNAASDPAVASTPPSDWPPDDPPLGPSASASGFVIPPLEAASGREVAEPSTEASVSPLTASPLLPTPQADASPIAASPTLAAHRRTLGATRMPIVTTLRRNAPSSWRRSSPLG